jgi:hypothetical protein
MRERKRERVRERSIYQHVYEGKEEVRKILNQEARKRIKRVEQDLKMTLCALEVQKELNGRVAKKSIFHSKFFCFLCSS